MGAEMGALAGGRVERSGLENMFLVKTTTHACSNDYDMI